MKKQLLSLALLALPTLGHAQVISPAPSGYQMLYATGTSVGNGADTNIDTLQTFTVPAGKFANVGDVIHIISSGTWASSTDNKKTNINFGASVVAAQNTTTSGVTRWSAEVWIVKTGSGTQSYMALGGLNGSSANNGVLSGTLTIDDTQPIVITVTGQNATNPVAGSVTAQGLVIEYLHQ